MFRTYNAVTVSKKAPKAGMFVDTRVQPIGAKDFEVLDGGRFRIKGVPAGTACMVMFYAPWCYYCTELKSTWIELANQLADVRVFAVDCDAHPSINAMLGIEGYPTIIGIRPNGELAWFDGKRTIDDLKQFSSTLAPKQAVSQDAANNKAVVLELTDANFDLNRKEFQGVDGPLVVMYYAPWCRFCKEMKPEWDALAHLGPELGVTVCALDCTKYSRTSTRIGIDGFPTIMLYKSTQFASKEPYFGSRKAEAIAKFITSQLRGPAALTEPQDEPSNFIQVASTPTATDPVPDEAKGTLVMFYTNDAPNYKEDKEQLLPLIAYKFSKYLRVGMINLDDNKDMGAEMGVDAVPCYVLYLKGYAYKYIGKRDKQGLYTFIADRLNGAFGKKTYIRFNNNNN